MANENTEGDSATETAVDDIADKAITNISELTQSFLDEGKPAEEADGETEQEVKKEEETEESKKTEESEETEGEVKAEETEETKEEEVQKEKTKNVLSNKKNLQKMRKRIDKVTKRAKTAEEGLEDRDERIESLEKQVKDLSRDQSGESGQKTFAEIAAETESIEGLESLLVKAEKAEEWAEDMLDQLRDSGEDEIEVKDVKFDRQQIKDLLRGARAAIKKDIPSKAKEFQQREQFDTMALEKFTFLGDAQSEDYKIAEEIHAELGNLLDSHPAGMVLLGLLAEGKKVLMARESKKETEDKKEEKKEETPLKKKSKIAQQVPGLLSTAAPARAGADEKKQKARDTLLQKSSLTENDLTALILAETE